MGFIFCCLRETTTTFLRPWTKSLLLGRRWARWVIGRPVSMWEVLSLNLQLMMNISITALQRTVWCGVLIKAIWRVTLSKGRVMSNEQILDFTNVFTVVISIILGIFCLCLIYAMIIEPIIDHYRGQRNIQDDWIFSMVTWGK